MSTSLAILRAAQQSPDRIAVAGKGYARTWAQTADRTARLAAGLQGLGLAVGDRLAILAGNCAEHMDITHAAVWAGIVIVPINTRLSAVEVAAILQDSGAAAIAYDAAHRALATDVSTDIGIGIRITLADDPDAIGFSDLLRAEPIDPVAVPDDALLGLYYTGGTTGKPKGVELTHLGFHVTSLDTLVALRTDQNCVYLHVAPFFHLADCTGGNAVTYAQGTHVFLDDLSPVGLVRAIEEFDVNVISLVPTQFHSLLDTVGNHPALARVRKVYYGAAPISPALLNRLLQAFTAAEFYQCYGQTEIAGACVFLPPEEHYPGSPNLGRTGKIGVSSYAKVVDADGKEQPFGTPGEILFRGARVMRGYWGMPEATAETIVDGWLHTGDVGVMTEGGFITVVDRMKDMIVTGGENVFCGEVESVIAHFPKVDAVAIVGVPNEIWGEAVHAFIVPEKGVELDPAEILKSAREKLAGYKTPKGVTFVDALPLSGVGKVRKDVLRNLWKSHQKKDQE